jgi:HK97 gp10 family phage protein
VDGLGDLNKLIADFEGAGLGTAAKGAALVKRTAFAIEGTAKQFVPVDTGATKNSIGTDTAYSGLEATIGPTTEYAPFLEEGTAKMAPYAFMGPAADRHSPDFVAGVEQLGGDLLA